VKGQKLKQKREFLGLTQAKLAEILDVKPNTVARWENGVLVVPKIIELAMLAIQIKMGKDVMSAAAELLPFAESAEREAKRGVKGKAKEMQTIDGEDYLFVEGEKYLSTNQISDRVGIKPRTVRDLFKDGKLARIKRGQESFALESDVEVLIYERNAG
jgi:transcriptional regulator with XRE-family HTH domain